MKTSEIKKPNILQQIFGAYVFFSLMLMPHSPKEAHYTVFGAIITVLLFPLTFPVWLVWQIVQLHYIVTRKYKK